MLPSDYESPPSATRPGLLHSNDCWSVVTKRRTYVSTVAWTIHLPVVGSFAVYIRKKFTGHFYKMNYNVNHFR